MRNLVIRRPNAFDEEVEIPERFRKLIQPQKGGGFYFFLPIDNLSAHDHFLKNKKAGIQRDLYFWCLKQSVECSVCYSQESAKPVRIVVSPVYSQSSERLREEMLLNEYPHIREFYHFLVSIKKKEEASGKYRNVDVMKIFEHSLERPSFHHFLR